MAIEKQLSAEKEVNVQLKHETEAKEKEKAELKQQLEIKDKETQELRERIQSIEDQDDIVGRQSNEIAKLKAEKALDLFKLDVSIMAEYPDMVEQEEELREKVETQNSALDKFDK